MLSGRYKSKVGKGREWKREKLGLLTRRLEQGWGSRSATKIKRGGRARVTNSNARRERERERERVERENGTRSLQTEQMDRKGWLEGVDINTGWLRIWAFFKSVSVRREFELILTYVDFIMVVKSLELFNFVSIIGNFGIRFDIFKSWDKKSCFLNFFFFFFFFFFWGRVVFWNWNNCFHERGKKEKERRDIEESSNNKYRKIGTADNILFHLTITASKVTVSSMS